MAGYCNGDGRRRSPFGAAGDVECLGAGEARGVPSGDGDNRIDMLAMYRLWWVRVEQRCRFVGQERRWRDDGSFVMLPGLYTAQPGGSVS